MNIFVILDTTGSMDAGCGASLTGINSPDKLDCAKAGVQALLQSMPYSSTSGVYDDVGIMVFPGLSMTLTGTTSTSTVSDGSLVGSATKGSITMTVTTNQSSNIGDGISGTGIPTGTTIAGATNKSPYTVTLSSAATSTTSKVTYPLTTTSTGTGAPYSLSGPSSSLLTDETDCNQPSTSRSGTGYDNVPSSAVTYPPWGSYSSATIPSADLGNFSNYTSPGYIDNYPGYEAVPLSSDYLSSSGVLNMTGSSNLVDSVSYAECRNQTYPGGDYYGIKDFVEYGVNGQHSYLAGAISEAQSVLAAQAAAQPTRTIDGTAYPVTSGIIILSDGELNDPDNTTDGVDPALGSSGGNIGFTSNTPCEDALNAATGAKPPERSSSRSRITTRVRLADDSGSGTGQSSLTSCTAPTSGNGVYKGGAYDGSACAYMSLLSSGSTYFADSSGSAGDLTSDFEQAASALNTAIRC